MYSKKLENMKLLKSLTVLVKPASVSEILIFLESKLYNVAPMKKMNLLVCYMRGDESESGYQKEGNRDSWQR